MNRVPRASFGDVTVAVRHPFPTQVALHRFRFNGAVCISINAADQTGRATRRTLRLWGTAQGVLYVVTQGCSELVAQAVDLPAGSGHSASTGFQVTAPAFPLSSASRSCMSSPSSEKSKSSVFERIRVGVADFGNGTKLEFPRCQPLKNSVNIASRGRSGPTHAAGTIGGECAPDRACAADKIIFVSVSHTLVNLDFTFSESRIKIGSSN